MANENKLAGEELLRCARVALGYSPDVKNFDPLNDASTIPEMMTKLRDVDCIDHLGGQAQLWYSRMFNAWVVTWKFKGDQYGTYRQGATINEALCRAIVTVSRGLSDKLTAPYMARHI